MEEGQKRQNMKDKAWKLEEENLGQLRTSLESDQAQKMYSSD